MTPRLPSITPVMIKDAATKPYPTERMTGFGIDAEIIPNEARAAAMSIGHVNKNIRKIPKKSGYFLRSSIIGMVTKELIVHKCRYLFSRHPLS